MCLAIPAQVVQKDGEKGYVNLGGARKEVMFTFTPEVEKGDWVLIHTGFALNVISEEDAEETLKLFDELGTIQDEMELENKNVEQ
ncbi:MAG: HypC/HybG/HupF family hydrogenase formation chaperone [Candidatus Cloacimonetes bacterium]|nr:HypC/HybG/HupF family hydrogenase formation chaperone [Candidatus Cloacimonadota bacterium]MCF7814529.1 HypC/HybG/HupF family hydrogenase formation chaperone [Candidatus Cloacimonadota bacterium]MCF7867679.1 HypC/HybG/HupF family hydrogenase formation chaperone [Candidatus Cloacimonadota bacterium]MCF7883523.1 HypC/HybG/HupF family hydrogenase formation chaperone [Candidatus Cloacimonadota bacterium]